MRQLEEFWALVAEVWRTSFLGVDVGKALTALLIFAAFLVFRRLLARIVMNRLEAFARRTPNKIDDRVVEAIDGPVRFIPVALGAFFAFDYLDLQGQWATFAENFVRSLIIFTIFWALYNAIKPLTELMDRLEKLLTTELIDWLVRAVRIAVALIGAAAVLETWGIQVGPILAGLGLFGVAVALGAQDLFKNLIAGILILAERRFRIGDWIKVDGVVEGTVEQIGFRSTLVRRFDKAPVYVPNAKLSDDAVTNFSSMTHRRIYWTIGVEYRTTVDQLKVIRDGIEAWLVAHEDFAQPPEVPLFVRIDKFNDSSIDIMVYCFTKSTVWGEWLALKEQLAYAVKDIVLGAGTAFAFPSTSLYVESLPGADGPEPFVPPSEPPKPVASEAAQIGATDSAEAGDGV